MTGRPKNYNRPPATKLIRLRPDQFNKMVKLRQGNEPHGDTISRALSLLEEYRKKVQALELDIEGLTAEIRMKDLANTNLISILKRRDEEIFRLKQQRRKYDDEQIQEMV